MLKKQSNEYVSYFENADGGLLENTSQTKQFIVPVGSMIRFRVRMGSKFAFNPTLLVNLPQKAQSQQTLGEEQKQAEEQMLLGLDDDLPNGGSGETLTVQPFDLLKADNNRVEETKQRSTDDVRFDQNSEMQKTANYTMTQPINEDGSQQQIGEGWQLSTTYLKRYTPDRTQTGQRPLAKTYYEFSVRFEDAGSFFVQLEYVGGKEPQQSMKNYTLPSYINVEPVLAHKQKPNKTVMCKELSLISVVSRCLGPIERWSKVLNPLSEQAYNAVHFTPIQVYGQSMSHYSIADQTEFSDYYFNNDVTKDDLEESKKAIKICKKEQKFAKVQKAVTEIRDELGLFSIVDIVLNHTANNSEWIQDHPEACYNTDDVPRLWPAYLLDAMFVQMTSEFSKGSVNWCPSAPYLNNETDLSQIISEMSKRALALKLHEFFLCDFDKADFLSCLPGLKQEQVKAKLDEFNKLEFQNKDPFDVVKEFLIENLAHGPERRQVSLKYPDAAIYLVHLNNQNVTRAIEQAEQIILRLNQYWTDKVKNQWIPEAMNSCEGTMRYHKLKLQKNLISPENYLLDPYFCVLQNEAQSKVVHNGWIGDHNPLSDFADEKEFNYLRRCVNIWGDSIKLRYGESPACSPYLWNHMSEYVAQMATIFDGFRLDNAHSTPIHVCQYMLQYARCHNPNILVMAELFTSSAELDALFTRKLNINGMIREIQNKQDVHSVGAYFHEVTCRDAVLGKLDQEFEYVHDPQEDGTARMYKLLTPLKPSDVIYDCTHDNPSPLQKFGTRRLALPTMGLLGLADQTIATTWGFDQLLPENLCIVKESRLYPIEDSPNQAWGESNKEMNDELPIVQPQEYVFLYKSGHSCESVSVAGEFNDWQPDVLKMSRVPNTAQWLVTMQVDASLQGRKVQFKFVEDGSIWKVDQTMPKTEDGLGNENNFFYLGDLSRSFNIQHQIKSMPDLRVARMLMNKAHLECTENGAGIFMHSQNDDTIVVVRQLSLTQNEDYDAYVTIQRFPFQGCNEASISTVVELPGFLTEIVFASNIVDNYQLPAKKNTVSSSGEVDSPPSEVFMHNTLQDFARVIDSASSSRLEFFNMPQGFTCLLKTRSQAHVREAVKNLDEIWSKSAQQVGQDIVTSGRLTLTDINHILYRCDDEEKDISQGQRGTYGLPDSGQFVYSGLQGPMHLFQQLKVSGEMGHSLLDNIRQGDWLIDYTLLRISTQLTKMTRLQGVHDFLSQAFSEVKKLPATLKPKYVCRIMEKLFNATLSLLIDSQMNQKVAFQKTPDPFLQQMVLSCGQMYAKVPSASFALHTNTMCAGLPHFSTGYMRCWGRDTFIALRGLLLTTGLYQEAKETILYFASVERHGLLPNLHDSANNTRFNARDATWFFLQAIKDYIEMADDGLSILQERFEAQFENCQIMTIEKLVYKILVIHASGINFRELNAGPRIDDQMKDDGFNVKVEADLSDTGFCFGGNSDNCGTWMDKMGSAPFVNKGSPATPRDGAPIELVGLQYSVLSFIAKLYSQGQFSQEGVDQITFDAWANLMKASFNKCFYIPEQASNDGDYDVEARYINRRGIYKDTYRSSQVYTDYQLRPNLCIAMAVAPELFVQTEALKCIQIVEEVLMTDGAMGIKTLDPSDPQYKGDYDNDDESRGHNYHQGPEWVWPVGFFLISKLNFGDYQNQREAAQDIVRHLLPHQEHMLTKDPWHSLPELTNSNGKICHHSCNAQAWSIATLLDALDRLGKSMTQISSN